jgi:hypothetical protein
MGNGGGVIGEARHDGFPNGVNVRDGVGNDLINHQY